MGCETKKMAKGLCPVSFGVAWGVVFALMMLGLAWTAHFADYGREMVEHMGAFYAGYGASIEGGLIGGLWGLLEGFLLGFFIALLYDCMVCCCKCKGCRKSGCCGKKSCGCARDCANPHCQCKSPNDFNNTPTMGL